VSNESYSAAGRLVRDTALFVGGPLSGKEPVEEFTRVALQRLYNAVKGDHSDPTDDSGRELELAFAMAERVLGDDTKDQYETDTMRAIRDIMGL
jgi:hypothetical protein